MRRYMILNQQDPQQNSLFARVLETVRGGVGTVGVTDALFNQFLAVPAEAATSVALKLAEEMARSGVELLDPALRNELARRVDQAALILCPDVLRAVVRFDPSAGVNGITGTSLNALILQQGSMGTLGRAVLLAKGLVDDGRRVLQVWQFEAQSRIVAVLLEDLSSEALSPDERRQLAIDADPVLKVIEEQIAELRGTRTNQAGTIAELHAQAETARKDALLLQTMRDIREGNPVDPEVRRTVAAHYAQRIRDGALAAPAVPTTAVAPAAAAPAAAAKAIRRRPRRG